MDLILDVWPSSEFLFRIQFLLRRATMNMHTTTFPLFVVMILLFAPTPTLFFYLTCFVGVVQLSDKSHNWCSNCTVMSHPQGFLIGARPENACEPIDPPPIRDNLTGAFIVLIKRFDCNFDIKVRCIALTKTSPHDVLLVFPKWSLATYTTSDILASP